MKHKIINLKKSGILIMAVFAMVTTLCARPLMAFADGDDTYWPEGPQINSPCAVVMEVNTGTVLYEKNSHEKHYPASITKILTTYLAILNCKMDEKVTFSKEAVKESSDGSSSIKRDVGEEMTMEQTLYGVMLESANECAYAAAEHTGKKLGGDYSTFIDLMNKEAKELGCNKIALGHHFNDVIETTLLSMFYGSEIKTMMPKLHSDNFEGLELIRPLYLVKEDAIITWKNSNKLTFINCACRFTENCTILDDGTSKRKEMKNLVKTLKKVNPNVDNNIFKSMDNVNLNCILGTKKDGTYKSFLEDYDDRK